MKYISDEDLMQGTSLGMADNMESQPVLKEEDSSITPAEPMTDEERELNARWQMMQERFKIKASMEIVGHECLIKQGDLESLPMGELHVLAAHKKQGKTTSSTLLASMILGSGFAGVQAIKQDAKVLVIQTEQHEGDAITDARYINTLCHTEFEDDRLDIYDLYGESPNEMRAWCNAGVRRYKPSIVIIDVVTDLLVDLSDKKEISLVMTMIKAWTRDVGCAVMAVMHYNKASDFLRDAFGTEIGNKCYDFLEASKEVIGEDDDMLFTIKGSVDSRGLPMKNIRYLRRKSDGLPIEFNGMTEQEQRRVSVAMDVCNFIKDYIASHADCCQKEIIDAVRREFSYNDIIKTSDKAIKEYINSTCKMHKEIGQKKGANNRTIYYIKSNDAQSSFAVRQCSAAVQQPNYNV